MEIIQTDFSRELSDLLVRYKKTIESNKNGIFIVDDEIGTNILISKATDATEDYRDKLIFVCGKIKQL